MSSLMALSGGVGGAKLALGLSRLTSGRALTIVANVGDDFDYLGLRVCPDIDTLLYTLAGRNDPDKGWGRRDETWSFHDALQALGGEAWFQLGDKDLALHVYRSQLLASGASLSAVTAGLAAKWGIGASLVPVSDERVRTIVETRGGELAFQTYFVREKCAPAVTGFRFDGADTARVSAGVEDALVRADLGGIIVCPSNPFVSIGPILAVDDLRRRLREAPVPVAAVSPIVGGEALKGPSAKMMRELGLSCSALGVARLYADFVDGFVLDEVDRGAAAEIEALGVQVRVAQTVMSSDADKVALAEECLSFLDDLSAAGRWAG